MKHTLLSAGITPAVKPKDPRAEADPAKLTVKRLTAIRIKTPEGRYEIALVDAAELQRLRESGAVFEDSKQ